MPDNQEGIHEGEHRTDSLRQFCPPAGPYLVVPGHGFWTANGVADLLAEIEDLRKAVDHPANLTSLDEGELV